MSWKRGAGWRVIGAVVRAPFINREGTFAALTLGTPGQRGEIKHEVKAFDAAVIAEIRELGVGQTVEVKGVLGSEPIKDKQKNPVMVDGYKKFVPILRVVSISVEGSSKKPDAAGEKPPQSTSAAGW